MARHNASGFLVHFDLSDSLTHVIVVHIFPKESNNFALPAGARASARAHSTNILRNLWMVVCAQMALEASAPALYEALQRLSLLLSSPELSWALLGSGAGLCFPGLSWALLGSLGLS